MAKALYEIKIGLADLYKTLIIYVAIHLIRFLVLMMFHPIFNKMGHKTTTKTVLFMTHAGLRGALGLVLCLVLMKNDVIPKTVTDLIMFHVSCLVIMTLLINANTVTCAIRCLGLQTSTLIEKKNILDFITLFKNNKKQVLDEMRL
jgi:NhaP-type Na+/H+ or K+/H+ antiporter